jgi:hypothetical protein
VYGPKLPTRSLVLSLQNIRIHLQSFKLIEFHLLRSWVWRDLFTVLGTLASLCKPSAPLRLENLVLR